jgi:hypothetical protein
MKRMIQITKDRRPTMSRNQQQSHFEPSPEDLDWFNRVQQGEIGLERPKVTHVTIPADPHSWNRRKAANRLGVTEDTLADEPDHLSIDEQGYE